MTKLSGSGQRATRVVDNAALIHEQQRAGGMVTYDLRMCKCVDHVIRMVAGKSSQILVEWRAIDALANWATF